MTQKIIQSQPNEISQEDILIQVLQTQKELKKNQEVLAGDVHYLKNEQPINPSISLELERLRKIKVINSLGGMESPAYKDRSFSSKVFRQAEKDFKEHFHIPRYDMLKRKDEQAGFDYWGTWEPSTNTKLEIQRKNSQTSLELIG
ncbi:TPA: ORF6C domain-containing protein [Streptococcus pyogenes]|nr:ORF6C domain-containing protein [Streptococcus pyogenes]HER0886560.1 ORF6C domain-containing protein [Streptococcus pyogenes]HER0889976.1 ORF6C domain-containing protein [Streptococcus pyogenes]HER0893343.1 ORF6C domain-containing protein [Streptococcus pyogenes]